MIVLKDLTQEDAQIAGTLGTPPANTKGVLQLTPDLGKNKDMISQAMKEENLNLYDDLPYFIGSDIQKEVGGDIWEICSLCPSFALRNDPHQPHWDFSVNMMTGEINYSGKPFNLDTYYPREVLAFMKKELPRMKPFIVRDNFQHIALVNGKWGILNWGKRYPNDWNGK